MQLQVRYLAQYYYYYYYYYFSNADLEATAMLELYFWWIIGFLQNIVKL